MNESLCCCPYVLHGVLLQVIKEIFKEMQNWSYIVFCDTRERFNYLYSFHEPVMNSNYSKNSCVVDDKSCTKEFGFTLFVMLSIDEN